MDIKSLKEDLLIEINKLAYKFELSSTVSDDYFEPGMMENLDQYYGSYDDTTNTIVLKTEVKGLRYEGRTPRLERLSVGDTIAVVREESNIYNSNNFMVNTADGKSLGNMPAELCNAIAPLYDMGYLTIDSATISYLEKIQDRSRYAKQGVLFIKLILHLRNI
jgi:hypothetical protein